MSVVSFKRCVGESPPEYGSRRAYCFVTPDYSGPCCLHYEMDNRPAVAGFMTYQQALTAATMAIFSPDNFQQVIIKACVEPHLCEFYPSAKAWLAHYCSGGRHSESLVRA